MLEILTGGRLTSWLFTSMEELNWGWPNTNPSSGREEDFNLQPPDYTSGTLTTKHVFPCSALATCIYFVFSLIASRNCMCPLWLALAISLVLVEQYSIKNHLNIHIASSLVLPAVVRQILVARTSFHEGQRLVVWRTRYHCCMKHSSENMTTN